MNLTLQNGRLFGAGVNLNLNNYDLNLIGNSIYLINGNDMSKAIDLPETGTLNGKEFTSSAELFEMLTSSFNSTSLLPKYTGSWMFRHFGNLQNQVVINNTEVDVTTVLAGLDEIIDGECPIYYDTVNGVFRCKTDAVNFFRFNLVLRLNGSVSGGTLAESIYEFRIRRPNNSLVAKQTFMKFQGLSTTLSDEIVCNIPTRVFSGGSDRYITEGFKITAARIVGGQTLTLPVGSLQNLFVER